MRSVLLPTVGFVVAIAALTSALMLLGGLVSRETMIVPFGAGILVGLANAWYMMVKFAKQNRHPGRAG
ncbi:hypothetical protein GTP91_01995 [Rugamonas sp. FT82W]|uniref:Uncharacterized protein n=1 Tax=Duganella vulcania TaxID=2692166 RepID=A0A845FZA5_9BURK|nr:hypothetical protein [Duganella vulcania]MYM85946.1 hypothetical protein [Duganella vulcania]